MKRWVTTLSGISAMIVLQALGFSCTEKEWVDPLVIPESQVQMTPSGIGEISDPNTPGITHSITRIPIIEVYPAHIDFGSVGIGDPTSRYVVIHNVGTMPLRVTSIEMKAKGNAFTFSSGYPLPFTVLPRATSGVLEPPPYGSADALLTVTFDPPTLGWYTGVMYIRSDDPTNPVVRIVMEGQGVLNTNGVAGSYLPTDTL